MSENKHQLWVTIGATLSSGFNSVVSKSTTKIQKIGGVIQNIEQQSVLSSRAIDKLNSRYGSLMATMNKHELILKKRSFYQSQIMGIIAMGAALAVPVRSAIQFEKSLAGIKSVVNFKESNGLQKLGEDLTRLSRSIPVTADELATIAATGGRFGIAENELKGFTEEIAKTSLAWGASITETSEHIGNLMKVFNVKNSELPQYFDAINELGNRTGATANNILTAINRSSDGLANFKLSIPHVAALASTIMSFGEGAEQAGSAVGNMLQKLSIAPKLGADAQKALHAIGLPSINLPEVISKDPKQVLDRLLEGLAKLDPKDRSTAMYAIFGRGASKMVGKLVDNLKLYKKNLQTVSDSMKYKGSRNEDYNIVLDTLDAKLTLLKNTISAFGREIGFSLAPAITKVVSTITNFLNPVLDWMQKNKELTSMITSVIAGIFGLRLAFWTIGYASTFLFGGFNRLIMGLKGLSLGFTLFGSAFRMFLFSWLGKFALIGGIIAAGLQETADGEIIFSFDVLSERVGKLFEKIKGIIPSIDQLKKRFSSVAITIGKYLSPEMRELLKQCETFIKDVWETISLIAAATGRKLLPVLKQGFSFIEKIMNPITKGLGVTFKAFNKDAGTTTGTVKSKLLPKFEALKEVVTSSEFIDLASSVGVLGIAFYGLSKITTLVTSKALSGAGTILGGVFSGIGMVGKAIWFFVGTIVPFLFQGLSLMASTFWFFASNVIPTMIRGTIALGSGLRYIISVWLPVLQRTLSQVATGIFGIFKRFPLTSAILIIGALAYFIITNWGKLKEFFLNFWTNIKTRFEGNIKKIKDIFGNLKKMIVVTVEFTYTLGRLLWTVGENIVAVIRKFVFGEDVVIPAWESIKQFFANLWTGIIPGFDEFLKKMNELGVTNRIIEAWESLKKYLLSFFDVVKPIWNGLVNPIKSLLAGKSPITAKIKSIMEKPKNDNLLAKNVAEIKKNNQNVSKTQNNNFTINIQANRNDNTELLAQKVAKKVSSFTDKLLYDPVPEVL